MDHVLLPAGVRGAELHGLKAVTKQVGYSTAFECAALAA